MSPLHIKSFPTKKTQFFSTFVTYFKKTENVNIPVKCKLKIFELVKAQYNEDLGSF